jgi:hypothetical protein
MGNQTTRILAILLVSCGVFLVSATETLGENEQSIYDQVLRKLESLTPDNTIEVRMGVEENKYKESFKISQETLDKLSQEGVPENIIAQLNELKENSYPFEDDLIRDVEGKIGEDQTIRYKSLILKYIAYEATPVYQPGEQFEMRFQAIEDSYVVLMHIAASKKEGEKIVKGGDITFLLPNRQFPNSKIGGGRVYSTLHDFDMKIIAFVPDETMFGAMDIMNLFCSTKKIVLFEPVFGEEYYTITPSDEKRLKALLDRLDQLENIEWSGKSFRFRIGSGAGAFRKIDKLGALRSTELEKFFPPIGTAGTTGKQDEGYQKLTE